MRNFYDILQRLSIITFSSCLTLIFIPLCKYSNYILGPYCYNVIPTLLLMITSQMRAGAIHSSLPPFSSLFICFQGVSYNHYCFRKLLFQWKLLENLNQFLPTTKKVNFLFTTGFSTKLCMEKVYHSITEYHVPSSG